MADKWVYASKSISGPGFVATFTPVSSDLTHPAEVAAEVAARYTAAAVNACAALGLSAAALESGAVAKLVEAAQLALENALRETSAPYTDWVNDWANIAERLGEALAALDDKEAA
jgi:sugar phosphate isomerase/epimerase